MSKAKIIGVALLIVVMLLSGACTSTATPTPEPESTAREIAELRNQITTLEERLSEQEAALQALQSQVEEKSRRIQELEDTVVKLEKALERALEEATPPPTLTPQPQQRQTLENEYFVINYPSGYEEDAKKAFDWAMWVRKRTMEKYPHDLGFKVAIYLNESREEGKPIAVTHSGTTEAEIFILRPSWEGRWGGYEQLENPFRRVLNHEYVHAPFYKDLYTKRTGYKDPPSWFAQGIAEYISENYLPSYEKRVRESVRRGSFTIAEPYSWGIYIVEHMYAKYGQEKVIKLIRSDALTFEDALRKELGVSPSEFEDGWRTYLAKKFVAESR